MGTQILYGISPGRQARKLDIDNSVSITETLNDISEQDQQLVARVWGIIPSSVVASVLNDPKSISACRAPKVRCTDNLSPNWNR